MTLVDSIHGNKTVEQPQCLHVTDLGTMPHFLYNPRPADEFIHAVA
jgi:hypothetical protein